MSKKQRFILAFIVAYLIVAFAWWAVLLNNTMKEAHKAQTDTLVTRLLLEQQIDPETDYTQHPSYLSLAQSFAHNRRMLLGEALVIFTSILVFLAVAYRILRLEVSAAEQQSNFLLSITHELKSPIASIRLILETFQKRRELPIPTQEKLATNGLIETDRLTALVNDLLLSARLETSYQLNPEPIDLCSVLQETADKVLHKYPEAQIKLDLNNGLPPVIADRMGLFSIAVNLLENAAKYSQPEPRIELTAYQAGTQEVIFTVSDNGIGIPDEEKRRIWSKFYRIGNEDTRATKGTGLGLYIVRQLVLLHRGHISLEDHQPGSRFIVSLPIR